MSQLGQDFGWMVLDTYKPHDGALVGGYERWLQEIDCPLLNRIPGMASYSCWSVRRSWGSLASFGRDENQPFSHFGFFGTLCRDDIDRFFAEPEWIGHAPTWVERWSMYPEAIDDLARNFCFSISKRVVSNNLDRTSRVLFLPRTEPDRGRERIAYGDRPRKLRLEHWQITENMVGNTGYDNFDLIYLDDEEDADQLVMDNQAGAEGVLIAGPN